jgi:curved DNA-binding protein CbpA
MSVITTFYTILGVKLAYNDEDAEEVLEAYERVQRDCGYHLMKVSR